MSKLQKGIEIWKPFLNDPNYLVSNQGRTKVTENAKRSDGSAVSNRGKIYNKRTFIRIKGEYVSISRAVKKVFVESNEYSLLQILNFYNIDCQTELMYVESFEHKYIISKCGRLFSLFGKFGYCYEMKPTIQKSTGYYSFGLRKKGQKTKHYRLHRLISDHFISRVDGKTFINHIDGNKLNNNVDNLEWCTNAENIKHAVRIGLSDKKGEKHPFSKLTEKQVIKYRELFSSGNYLIKDLALKAKVHRRTLSDALYGKTWGWLNPSLSDFK